MSGTLMSIRNINKTSMRTCCKDCLRGNGSTHGRKANRRAVKRAERQRWKREVTP
jgi:hypothetical protein